MHTTIQNKCDSLNYKTTTKTDGFPGSHRQWISRGKDIKAADLSQIIQDIFKKWTLLALVFCFQSRMPLVIQSHNDLNLCENQPIQTQSVPSTLSSMYFLNKTPWDDFSRKISSTLKSQILKWSEFAFFSLHFDERKESDFLIWPPTYHRPSCCAIVAKDKNAILESLLWKWN